MCEGPEWEPYRKRFAAYYYTKAEAWGRGVAINYRHEGVPWRCRGARYRARPARRDPPALLADRRLRRLEILGYIQDESYRSADQLLDELVDIASKNGCLLLNVCPRPDGTIPEEAEILRAGQLESNPTASTRDSALFGFAGYYPGPFAGTTGRYFSDADQARLAEPMPDRKGSGLYVPANWSFFRPTLFPVGN